MPTPDAQPGESLSIVVPVFNEAASIVEVIDDLTHMLDSVPGSELVVVDDASTDETYALLASIAKRDERVRVVTATQNRGHGPSLVAGMAEGTRSWLFLADADGQIAASEFESLWARRDSADLVLGSRVGRVERWHRRALSYVVRAVGSTLAGAELSDPNVPFKLVRRAVWEDLRPYVPRNPAVPSLLIAVGAVLRGWRLETVAVSHRTRSNRRSKLQTSRLIRLSARAGVELLSFRRRVLSAAPRRERPSHPELPAASTK